MIIDVEKLLERIPMRIRIERKPKTKDQVEDHMLNMKAIMMKYRGLSAIDPERALRYFFTMMVTEIARLQSIGGVEVKSETDEAAEARVNKIESTVRDAFDVTFGFEELQEEVIPQKHQGYL